VTMRQIAEEFRFSLSCVHPQIGISNATLIVREGSGPLTFKLQQPLSATSTINRASADQEGSE
jgi:hypothetical protein